MYLYSFSLGQSCTLKLPSAYSVLRKQWTMEVAMLKQTAILLRRAPYTCSDPLWQLLLVSLFTQTKVHTTTPEYISTPECIVRITDIRKAFLLQLPPNYMLKCELYTFGMKGETFHHVFYPLYPTPQTPSCLGANGGYFESYGK